MAISMFETRTMLAALSQAKPPHTFLRDTFFKNRPTFDSEVVDVDIVKGARRLAPIVSTKIGSKTVERGGYSTNSYRPPLVAPDMVTTAEQLLKRMPGENLIGGLSPEERAQRQLGQDLAELDNLVTRREEAMCAEALTLGQVTLVGEGVSEVMDYGLTNVATNAGDDLWSAAASDPRKQVAIFRLEVLKKSGVAPTMGILGADAAEAFLANVNVQKYLNLRQVDLGAINPQQLPNGVTYLGRFNDSGVDFYRYDDWYINDEGTEVAMIDSKKLILASPLADMRLLYGAVTQIEGDAFATIAQPRVPKSWTQNKPDARFVKLSARPLPVVTQIDSIYVAKVLA